MTRKSQKVIHWTLFGFRTIKAIFRKAPFLRYHPAYLTFLMNLKPCKSLQIKLWLFLIILNNPTYSRNLVLDTIWARKVGVPCLNNCPWSPFCWLEIWTHPFTTLFQTKNSHFPRCVSNTEFLHWFGLFYVKIIRTNHNLMCKLLQGFRIIKTKSNMLDAIGEKGLFWKWLWWF